MSRSEGGRSAGPDASDTSAGTEADGTSVRGGCERFADDGGGSKFLAWCWSMFFYALLVRAGDAAGDDESAIRVDMA